jgi:serine/threonine-protein kinase
VRWAKSSGGKGRVRITPQLVRVSDDTPIWTETYDREVSDIFDVQTDIATHVVDALGITLHGSERERLEERPTENVEAYEAYLRALNLVCNDFVACDEEILRGLERAVELDPGFLAAWSEIVREHAMMYHVNADRTEARLGRARAALDRMDAIDSGHPLTRLARGFYYYHGYRDYDRALAEFRAVAEARPNDTEPVYAMALIDRRKGDIAASASGMERCVQGDPRNSEYLWELGTSYDAMRMPEKALACLERSYAIKNDPGALTDLVNVTLRHYGDVDAAKKILARAPDGEAFALLPAQVLVSVHERDYDSALASLRRAEIPMPSIQANISAWIALIEALDAGKEKARPQLQGAARQLEAALHDAPGDPDTRGTLAHVYALLDRPDDAIREAKLAVDVVSKDAFSGPAALEQLALVYATTGHADEALDLIERLLNMNYGNPLTTSDLRLDPVWDPIRDHPKFKELLKRST